MSREKIYDLISNSQDGNAIRVEESFKEIISEKVSELLEGLKQEVFNEQSKRFSPFDAKQILDKHDAHGDFHSLKSDTVQSLVDIGKKSKYKSGKNTPGSYGRMFHGYLTKLAAKHKSNVNNESEEFDLEENSKREIYVDGKYHSTTTQSKTNREAKEKFLSSFPEHKDKKIQVSKVSESEEFEEETLDELSKKTLGSYINKATNRAADHSYISGHKDGSGKNGIENHKRSDKRIKGIRSAVKKLTKEEFDLEEAVHPLDAHRILSQNGGRDKNFFSLSSSHVDGLTKAAKDLGYKHSGSTGKSYARAFHDHLTKQADKFVDQEGKFKPEMRDKFKESVDLEEAVHPDEALKILKKHTDIDDNTNFFSLKSHQVDNIEAERKKAKFSGRNSMGRSATRQFYDHLHKQAAKSANLHKEDLDHLESVDLEEGRKQEADEHAATELHLYGVNDSHLHHHSAQPIIDNLKKKVKKGTYDHEKATKLWRYHADRAADRYKKEFGSGHFTPATRDMAAKEFRDHYDEHVRG